MLFSIRPRHLRGKFTSLDHFNFTFNEACKLAKTTNLTYEVLRAMKNEVLVKVKQKDSDVNDYNFKLQFDKMIKRFI